MQNFIKELADSLENNTQNNFNIGNLDFEWNDLNADNLELYNKKIISKYRNEMLIERNNILQDFAKNTEDLGEMYYIYSTSSNQQNSLNLCACTKEKSHQVITKDINDLPQNAELGSVLRKQGDRFILDIDGTQEVGRKINNMIKEKIEEQDKYLGNKRIDGHIYEVHEKYSERIWLYDLNNNINGVKEGIEEIEFPKDLFETAKKGDLFIYTNGKYEKYIK